MIEQILANEDYMSWIESKRDPKRSKNSKEFELHHIIPIHWGGAKSGKNTLPLTPDEHCTAHHILYKYFGSDNDRSAALKNRSYPTDKGDTIEFYVGSEETAERIAGLLHEFEIEYTVKYQTREEGGSYIYVNKHSKFNIPTGYVDMKGCTKNPAPIRSLMFIIRWFGIPAKVTSKNSPEGRFKRVKFGEGLLEERPKGKTYPYTEFLWQPVVNKGKSFKVSYPYKEFKI